MGMFGTKAGMTQIFTPEGLAIPATVIAMEEGNVVTQVHTVDTMGYNAVQVGYQECAERKVTQPEAGHCKKAGAKPMRKLREFKVGRQLLCIEFTMVVYWNSADTGIICPVSADPRCLWL